MKELAEKSGENGEFYNITDNDIEQIFNRIQLNLGLRVQEENVILQHEDI